MFRLSPIIILFPKSTWPYLPFWKQFVAVWDHLFKVAAEQVLQKMEEIEQKVHLGQPVEGEYLTHLLVSEQMSVTEILGSIAELLLAGIDTVRCVFYEVLFHSREKLYQEVISVCPGDKVPTSDDIIRMPWLKAVVRETLQMYPGVPGNTRINVENDIVVGELVPPVSLCCVL
uniref:Uncharacterized protein n=1 Tax=Oncorhynchus mykiss TaxID=8022 RepID=A0A8C7U565_ONCMY